MYQLKTTLCTLLLFSVGQESGYGLAGSSALGLTGCSQGADWAMFLPAALPNSHDHWQDSVSCGCRMRFPPFYWLSAGGQSHFLKTPFSVALTQALSQHVSSLLQGWQEFPTAQSAKTTSYNVTSS